MRSIELFAGTGGLALGCALAGFDHVLVTDWNKHACATLEANRGNVSGMDKWEVKRADVRQLDYSNYSNITLLTGGAPCQPFSLGGKHRGDQDDRNMFPEVFRAVRALRPEAIVLENVKGLLRRTFRPYFDYIILQLEMPHHAPLPDEDWRDHKDRLLELRSKVSDPADERYDVAYQLVDAADFGVPQHRHRVVMTAFRRDLGTRWQPMVATHSKDALLYAQYVDGSYWKDHGLDPRETPPRLMAVVESLAARSKPMKQRWQTVRDAIEGLPAPIDGVPHATIPNHIGNPGARSYAGHTGSPWDEPSKALKAGDHGVPGGENMIRNDDGTVRYYTVREAARIQTFPDAYVFQGPWGECMRQLGNAVPVTLAERVAELVYAELIRSLVPDVEPLAAAA